MHASQVTRSATALPARPHAFASSTCAARYAHACASATGSATCSGWPANRVNESGDKVTDHCATVTGLGTCIGHTVKLPLESAGTLLMFRVFDHLSYGLVLAETNPIADGDQVVRP